MPKIENFWDDYGIKNGSNIKLLPVLGTKDNNNPVLRTSTNQFAIDSMRIIWGCIVYDKDGTYPFMTYGNVQGRVHYFYFAQPDKPYTDTSENWLGWQRACTAYAYSDNYGEYGSWVKPNMYLFDYDALNQRGYRIPDPQTWTPIGDGGTNNIIDMSGVLLDESEIFPVVNRPTWYEALYPSGGAYPNLYKTERKGVVHVYNFNEIDPNKRFVHFWQPRYDSIYMSQVFYGHSSDGVNVKYKGANNKVTSGDIILDSPEINSFPFITHEGKLGWGIKLFPMNPNKTNLSPAGSTVNAYVHGYFEFDLTQDLNTQFNSKYPNPGVLANLDWSAPEIIGSNVSILDPPDTSEGEEGGMHDMICIPVKDIWGDHYVIFMDMYQVPGKPHPNGGDYLNETALFGIRGTKFEPKSIKRIGTKFLEKIIRPTYDATSWDRGMMVMIDPIRLSDDHFPLIETETETIWFYTGSRKPNPEQAGADYHMDLGRVKWRKNGITKVQNLNGQPGDFDTPLHTKSVGEVIKVNYKGNVKLELLDNDGVVIPGYSKADCTLPNGDYLNKVATWGSKDARELTQFKMKWYLEG